MPLRPSPLLLALLALAGCASSATRSSAPDPVQEYVTALRSELSQGKVDVLAGNMELDAEQASVFWPIYHDYETELFELGERRLEAIHRFAEAHRSGALEGAKAGELVAAYFALEGERLDLLRKYHGILDGEMDPLTAAQFVQLEHRFGTVIDLLIASQLPLLGSQPSIEASSRAVP